MGVACRGQKTIKMQMLSLLPLLCIVSAAPEGGLFGFGLLGGDSTSNTTTTTAPTTTTTASPATTTALVEALTSTTASSSSDNSGIIQNLVDVLTGKVATIALDQLSSLLGLNNPVPSPLTDPIGFLTHPLISPIILAAVTLNPPRSCTGNGRSCWKPCANTHLHHRDGSTCQHHSGSSLSRPTKRVS